MIWSQKVGWSCLSHQCWDTTKGRKSANCCLLRGETLGKFPVIYSIYRIFIPGLFLCGWSTFAHRSHWLCANIHDRSFISLSVSRLSWFLFDLPVFQWPWSLFDQWNYTWSTTMSLWMRFLVFYEWTVFLWMKVLWSICIPSRSSPCWILWSPPCVRTAAG